MYELNNRYISAIRTLQSDQGQGQGRGASEEEANGEIEPLRDAGITTRGIVVEVRHLLIGSLLVGRVVQFGEDPEPVRVELVHTLASDLELDLLDELLGRVERGIRRVLRHRHLEEEMVQEITVTRDGHSDTLSEPNGARERGFDRLDGETGVPLVQTFEERNRRISRQVDI